MAITLSQQRSPLLASFFAALFLAVIPTTAQAQFPPQAAATNCSGQVGVAYCQCEENNTYSRNAQEKTMAVQKVITNGMIPSMKETFCWNNVMHMLQNFFNAIAASDVLSALFNTIITNIINILINWICAAFAVPLGLLMGWQQSWMCLPLPHFNLNLNMGTGTLLGGGFPNGVCAGEKLYNLMNGLPGDRPFTPGAWQIWNYTTP